MPRMSPPGISRATCPDVSSAEIRVYEALEGQLPDDFLVLHSLWLKQHRKKLIAEIDFVVITDRGVFLLEVKGGTIRRDINGWHFFKRSGELVASKREGPFDQAKGAYYAMRSHLEETGRRDLFHDHVWWYGVITPDCELIISDSDTFVSKKECLGLGGFPERLADFLDGLASYGWEQKVRLRKNYTESSFGAVRPYLSAEVRQEIYRHLRPDFECVLGLGIGARQAEQVINRLTTAQYDLLDYAENNPRILISGYAGSGKTLLAFEQARREGVKGKRVLFTCFNRMLSERLALRAAEHPEMGNVTVANYHRLIQNLLLQKGVMKGIPEEWSLFNENIVACLDSCVMDEDLYDYLVIDEAQDLMTRPFAAALGLLLRGGISSGEWLVCLDPAQVIFSKQYDEDMLEELGASGVQFTLRENLRNTRNVAAYVKGLSAYGGVACHDTMGPEVGIVYYRQPEEYLDILRRTVNTITGELSAVGMLPSNVTILAAEKSFLPDCIYHPGAFTCVAQEVQPCPDSARVVATTIHKYKGLESTAIVLVGLHHLERESVRQLLYVGASRAKSILRVILPEQDCKYVQDRLGDILDALYTEKKRTAGLEDSNVL